MSNRRLLLVAFHFPPIQGSTGTVRTVAFSKYLTRNGWDVSVLTVDPKAYEDTARENERLIPSGVDVHRAWGRDCRRSFAVSGRYPLPLALPDRWQSWIAGGFVKGLRLIRVWKPDVIMSTYPIPSAHLLGFLLHKKFKVPWVAEFRDPMLQVDYPTKQIERRIFAKVENVVFSNASRIVVTTDGCKNMYLDRFPNLRESRIFCIPNGYDPEMFSGRPAPQPKNSGPLMLLHSGLLYPDARNPTPFFRAVRTLHDRGYFDDCQVEFRLRATGHDERYQHSVDEYGIAPYVRILPRIPYEEALTEMLTADALMLFQASNCNDQIPAKVYEYLYCQKPILAFTDPAGETGKLLGSVGITDIAPLEDPQQIEQRLAGFLKRIRAGNSFVANERDVARYSRESLTFKLAAVLGQAIDEP